MKCCRFRLGCELKANLRSLWSIECCWMMRQHAQTTRQLQVRNPAIAWAPVNVVLSIIDQNNRSITTNIRFIRRRKNEKKKEKKLANYLASNYIVLKCTTAPSLSEKKLQYAISSSRLRVVLCTY